MSANKTFKLRLRTNRAVRVYESRINAVTRNARTILSATERPDLATEATQCLQKHLSFFERQQAAIRRDYTYHKADADRHGVTLPEEYLSQPEHETDNPLVIEYLKLLQELDDALYVLYRLLSAGKLTKEDYKQNAFEVVRITERMTGRLRSDGEALQGKLRVAKDGRPKHTENLATSDNPH